MAFGLHLRYGLTRFALEYRGPGWRPGDAMGFGGPGAPPSLQVGEAPKHPTAEAFCKAVRDYREFRGVEATHVCVSREMLDKLEAEKLVDSRVDSRMFGLSVSSWDAVVTRIFAEGVHPLTIEVPK